MASTAEKVPSNKVKQFWKARTTMGRVEVFQSPVNLMEAAQQYFDWVDENPLLEEKPFMFQGEIIVHQKEKPRAMTLNSIQLFLDCSHEAWLTARKDENLKQVIANIERIIFDYKLIGAAGDLFNANIISRDLGLMDKTQTEHVTVHITGKDTEL